MSISKEDEEKVETLLVEIEKLSREAPKAPEGWVPIGNEDGFVIASKIVEDKVKLQPFKREGVWEKIGKFFDEKEKRLKEIEKILQKYPEYSLTTF